jgi:hypothetical protein
MPKKESSGDWGAKTGRVQGREKVARAQEITIWGHRNQLVTNPIQSSPHGKSLPLLHILPSETLLAAPTTRCSESMSRVNLSLGPLEGQLRGRLEGVATKCY